MYICQHIFDFKIRALVKSQYLGILTQSMDLVNAVDNSGF